MNYQLERMREEVVFSKFIFAWSVWGKPSISQENRSSNRDLNSWSPEYESLFLIISTSLLQIIAQFETTQTSEVTSLPNSFLVRIPGYFLFRRSLWREIRSRVLVYQILWTKRPDNRYVFSKPFSQEILVQELIPSWINHSDIVCLVY